MLTLVTANPAKYAPFARDLERWRVALAAPPAPLPELQTLDFTVALEAKARAAAERFGRPVLVDDAGLVLDAYPAFPGPVTSVVLRSLGVEGLRRLLAGVSPRGTMECHLGCWIGGALRSWRGSAAGRLDLTRPVRDGRMMLADLFVPDDAAADAPLLHRARALAALERDVFALHLDGAGPTAAAGAEPSAGQPCGDVAATGPPQSAAQCPFCIELDGDPSSLYARMMGARLPSRIVYEDEHFVVMPALGAFIEGGLLLLTKQHLLSFAHLPAEWFAPLERLLAAVSRALAERWGTPALVFEHGPAPERGKGVCCVDHAHLNLFPARATVHPHLAQRMHLPLAALADLAPLRQAEYGYLFVQELDGTRRAYDGELVPTQLVRRLITAQLGLPERWHWRDYPGHDELLATYHALHGRISP